MRRTPPDVIRRSPAGTVRWPLARVGMSMENSGADYPRRLKRDQEQQPQTYVEPAATPVPADSDPQERRRNPRYKCEGSATFRVEGTNVRTWGTFTDLSCSGCYVELKATFPAGAIIDLELELNGVRAQVKGEVRVSYPFLGMGVAFRDLTTENRMQIQAMIDSILPAPLRRSVGTEPETAVHPASMPIILNPAAALQALADFFEGHTLLSKDEFIRLLRKSQGV
ncbi:MAG TPA: PilZ domain-containing protein [Terriglobales bacterium]|nr:PilZ domain-containing protein [Terriglobales bacterium]